MKLITHLIYPVLILGSAASYSKDYDDVFDDRALKTLFTSPEQRQKIDSNRKGITSAADALQAGPSTVNIKGIVKRSDNKSVVWINGKNTMESDMVGGVKVYPDKMNEKTNKIPVLIDGRRVYIKPGETWFDESSVTGTKR